jgi:hypothetical protein
MYDFAAYIPAKDNIFSQEDSHVGRKKPWKYAAESGTVAT